MLSEYFTAQTTNKDLILLNVCYYYFEILLLFVFFFNYYRSEFNLCLHCASLLTICTGLTMASLCIFKRANPVRLQLKHVSLLSSHFLVHSWYPHNRSLSFSFGRYILWISVKLFLFVINVGNKIRKFPIFLWC